LTRRFAGCHFSNIDTVKNGRRLVAAVLILLTAGCASRRHAAALTPAADEGARLLAEGCYECLREARTLYDRAANQPGAAVRAWRDLFFATLLVTVRSMELGLPTERLAADAEALAEKLRNEGPPTLVVPASIYIDALAFVQGETAGLDPDRRAERAHAFRSRWTTDGTLPRARLALAPALASEMAAQYIALAIDCEDTNARKQINAEEIRAQHPSPLTEFRLALCRMDGSSLAALRQSNPRWADTLLFEGRLEMSAQPGGHVGRAAALFADAHRAFPESPSVTLALASARNALGEYASALELYDSVLSSDATHRDALLGRVVSLSYLERFYEASAAASRIIDLETQHLGPAYYWRAWNRYRVHQLPQAWEDIREATNLSPDSAVLTLAGYIAYARQWPETAIDRLARAFALDTQNCDAIWTEGLVHVDKEDWPVAAARFVTAVSCFTASVETIKSGLMASRADTPSPAALRRTADAEKRLATAEHRRAQAAFNAASAYARSGRNADARAYAEIAAEHPLLKEKALALKGGIPQR
jgi:tetratricopeptide (TPR) repeat protein